LSYKHRSYRRTDSPLSHRISLPEWTHRWKEKEQKGQKGQKEQKGQKGQKEKEKDQEEEPLGTSHSYKHSWTYTER